MLHFDKTTWLFGPIHLWKLFTQSCWFFYENSQYTKDWDSQDKSYDTLSLEDNHFSPSSFCTCPRVVWLPLPVYLSKFFCTVFVPVQGLLVTRNRTESLKTLNWNKPQTLWKTNWFLPIQHPWSQLNKYPTETQLLFAKHLKLRQSDTMFKYAQGNRHTKFGMNKSCWTE